jgi:hypothetical protein
VKPFLLQPDTFHSKALGVVTTPAFISALRRGDFGGKENWQSRIDSPRRVAYNRIMKFNNCWASVQTGIPTAKQIWSLTK